MRNMEKDAFKEKILKANESVQKIRDEVGKVIVGQSRVIDRLLIALMADGHILLEGLPGLAKTLAVNTLAHATTCEYKRIQFTPDLLPADLIGTSIFNPKEGTFSVKKGPIFTNVLVADEINRAPAKVQSALLEAMQERQVTISGEPFLIKNPYFVLATQNPIESEGTYPLPEAQMDRFMFKVTIDYPTKEQEREIMDRMGTLGTLPKASPVLSGEDILEMRKLIDAIYIDEKITSYILEIIFFSRQPKKLDHLILTGASPRASLFMKLGAKAHAFLQGRSYVTPFDVQSIAKDVLSHRLRISYEAEAEGITADDLVKKIMTQVQPPA